MNGCVPKRLWILWLQGKERAPQIVKNCIRSWEHWNVGWEINVLDLEGAMAWVPDCECILGDNKDIVSNQVRANVIRINLLARFGGVWADATCFCCYPLDEWIHESARAGFFAFHKPSNDCLMQNFFMASRKGCYLTTRLCHEYNDLWLRHRFVRGGGGRPVRLAGFLLNRSPRLATLWFSPLFTRILRMYPYYAFQYTFNRLVFNDRRFLVEYTAMTKISGDLPHFLLHRGLRSQLDQQCKSHVDEKKSPVYKLTWRKGDEMPEGSKLKYLFSTISEPDLLSL